MCLFLVGDWFSFLEISLFNGKGVELRLQRGQYIDKIKRSSLALGSKKATGLWRLGQALRFFNLFLSFNSWKVKILFTISR